MDYQKTFDKEYFDNDQVKVDDEHAFYAKVNWYNIAGDLLVTYRMIRQESCHSFLDVGCAKGHLVQTMTNLGVQAQGIEISDYAIENAVPGAQGRITKGSVQDLQIKGTLDLISAHSVLHYLENESDIETFAVKCAAHAKVVHIGEFPLGSTSAIKKYWLKLDEHTKMFKPFEWWAKTFTDRGLHLVKIDGPDEGSLHAYFTNPNL